MYISRISNKTDVYESIMFENTNQIIFSSIVKNLTPILSTIYEHIGEVKSTIPSFTQIIIKNALLYLISYHNRNPKPKCQFQDRTHICTHLLQTHCP